MFPVLAFRKFGLKKLDRILSALVRGNINDSYLIDLFSTREEEVKQECHLLWLSPQGGDECGFGILSG